MTTRRFRDRDAGPAWVALQWGMIPDQIHPIFGSPLLVGAILAALVVLSALALWREARLSRTRRAVLGLLRGTAVVVLAVALMQPSCTNREVVRQRATLLIGLDASRSMTLPHVSGGPSRWEAQLAALAAAEPQLRAIASEAEVLVHTYDRTLRPVGQIGAAEGGLASLLDGRALRAATGTGPPFAGELDLPTTPEGERTDLAGPLTKLIRDTRGRRVIGMVWMGDGIQTERRPDVTLDQARGVLARLGQPLLTVRLGSSTGRDDERDLAVETVPPELVGYVGNEILINATVSIQGFSEKEIPTELVVTNQATGARQTFPGPSLVVPASEPSAVRSVQMTYRATEAGQFTATVRIPPQVGEATEANNELSSFLTVREGSLRVLYVEGSLRIEQKFLRRSLDASDDLDVEFLYLSPKDRERWPVDLSTALAQEYDVYILGDIDSGALADATGGPGSLQKIRDAVERGKGLLALGGFHALDAGGYGQTPLAEVLPITFDRFARQPFSETIAPDLHRSGPIRLQATGEHFITDLLPGDEGAVWNTLPELDGANRLRGLTGRASVLLEDPAVAVRGGGADGRQAADAAILVTGPFGQGRVAVMAADSTWRWWMQGYDREHRRFWRQLTLWLAGRDQDQDGTLWVNVSGRRLLPGDDLTVSAAMRDPYGDRLADTTITTTVTPLAEGADVPGLEPSPIGDPLPTSAVRERADATESVFQPDKPGRYQVVVTAARPGRDEKRYQTEIVVLDQDPELTTPRTASDTLGQLAALTRQAGGRAVAPEELPAALAELADRPLAKDETRESTWKLGDTAGDAWTLFLIMLVALAGEWALRRRWSLP